MSHLGLERGLAYVSLGNMTNSILGAILWLYLASQLTASHYGEINYLIAIVSIATPIALLGFETTLVSYVAKGCLKMETESSALIVISVIIVSVILFIATQSFAVVTALISMVIWTWVAADMLGKQEFKKFAIGMTIQRILTLVTVPILYLFLSVDGAIYGFAISNFVLCSRYFRALKQLDFSISSIVPIKNYFFHSYMIGIAKVLPYFADKLIIFPLFDALTVGYYQFGAQIASFSSLVPFILFGYLLPRLSQGVTKGLQNTKRLGIAFSIGMTTILFLLMPYLVDSFYPKFQPATTATQIIILSGVPLSISAIYNSGFMAIGRQLTGGSRHNNIFIFTVFTNIFSWQSLFSYRSISCYSNRIVFAMCLFVL